MEIVPVFKFGETVKIRAILFRKWEKTAKNGIVIARVKGRDYFDLMWYLQKGVVPNFYCIEKINSKEKLKNELIKIIENLDYQSIKYDLEGLIENRDLIVDLGNNMKEISEMLIEKW